MPHLGRNIPSIGSEIVRFASTTSDIYTFSTLSNRLLKRIQKQGSKIFDRHFTLFNVFADTAATLIKIFFHCLKFELYMCMFAICIVLFCLILFVCFFLNVCLFFGMFLMLLLDLGHLFLYVFPLIYVSIGWLFVL